MRLPARTRLSALPLVLVLVGCYQSHGLPPRDGGVVDVRRDVGVRPVDVGAPRDAGACDLSRVTCSVLPNCLGDDPPRIVHCDDIRICLASDPGDVMANAIASVADRIECTRADSCDFLCTVTDGGFDDEVRSEICAITRVAPAVTIECAIWGP